MGAKVHKPHPEPDPIEHETRVNTLLNALLSAHSPEVFEKQSKDNAFRNRSIPPPSPPPESTSRPPRVW